MKAKKSTSRGRPNGRILTVKQLPKASYDVIHRLPHGMRGMVMKKLLAALAKLPAKAVLEARVTVVETT